MGKGRTAVEGRRRWRQWTKARARRELDELAASGESRASFARRKGVSVQRLAYWEKRFGPEEAMRFVPVALPAGAPGARIEIAASGVVIRVREDLEVEHVARLVEAIGRRVGGGAC